MCAACALLVNKYRHMSNCSKRDNYEMLCDIRVTQKVYVWRHNRTDHGFRRLLPHSATLVFIMSRTKAHDTQTPKNPGLHSHHRAYSDNTKHEPKVPHTLELQVSRLRRRGSHTKLLRP